MDEATIRLLSGKFPQRGYPEGAFTKENTRDDRRGCSHEKTIILILK